VRIIVCPYRHPTDYDSVRAFQDRGADQVVLTAAHVGGDDLLSHLDALYDQVIERINR
jgi:hypothetical protein